MSSVWVALVKMSAKIRSAIDLKAHWLPTTQPRADLSEAAPRMGGMNVLEVKARSGEDDDVDDEKRRSSSTAAGDTGDVDDDAGPASEIHDS